MTLFDILLTSTTAMRTNLLRTFLSMLGIIIAIAAVIGLTAATEGKKEGISERIRGLGSDLLVVRPGATQQGGVASLPGLGASLYYEDAVAIGDADFGYVDGMASLTGSGGGSGFAPVAQVIYRGQNAATVLIGTEPSYQSVRDHYVARGRFISEDDVTKKGLSVVLGANIAEKIFGSDDPVGKPVRIFAGLNERFGVAFNFTVIGVMERKGAGGTGDEDDRVFVPLPSFQSRVPFLRNARGYTNVSQIYIKLADRSKADVAKQDISVLLRDRHASATDDFTIETQSEVLSTATEVEESLRTLVVSVASIALIVGGLGIVNIMLVSVTERTREIGIRKAIGARRTDILMQFLVEAVLITIIGGSVGVLIGWGATRGLEQEFSFNLPNLLVWDPPKYEGGENYVVTPLWVGVGLLVSAVTGLIAGVYPAWRASRLDPIEALRHE